jgi:nucleotide-binding universal stress UspA family protein
MFEISVLPLYSRRSVETVLLAADGAGSEAAIGLAAALAARVGRRVVAVHVGGPDDAALAERLEAALAGLRAAGAEAVLERWHTGTAQPAAAIAEAARAHGAALIVVATGAHGAPGGRPVAGVAAALLHKAPCPVVAVPPAGVDERLAAPAGARLATAPRGGSSPAAHGDGQRRARDRLARPFPGAPAPSPAG